MMEMHKKKLTEFFFDDDHSDSLFIDYKDLSYLSKGKAIRSTVCNKICNMLNINESASRLMEDTVEMIHNATLIHDDVIDNSLVRRGSKTLNASYSNKKTVLIGDYILAKAIYDLSSLNKPILVRSISQALKSLVDGEIFQMEHKNPFFISEEDYIVLAKNKTGSLFSWSLSAPFEYISDNQDLVHVIKDLGFKLGVLFQMKDDLLDFIDIGKTKNIDFRNKNVNYVFTKLEVLNSEERRLLMQVKDYESLPSLLKQKFLKALDKTEVQITNNALEVRELTEDVCKRYSEEIDESEFLKFVNKMLMIIVGRPI